MIMLACHSGSVMRRYTMMQSHEEGVDNLMVDRTEKWSGDPISSFSNIPMNWLLPTVPYLLNIRHFQITPQSVAKPLTHRPSRAIYLSYSTVSIRTTQECVCASKSVYQIKWQLIVLYWYREHRRELKHIYH